MSDIPSVADLLARIDAASPEPILLTLTEQAILRAWLKEPRYSAPTMRERQRYFQGDPEVVRAMQQYERAKQQRKQGRYVLNYNEELQQAGGGLQDTVPQQPVVPLDDALSKLADQEQAVPAETQQSEGETPPAQPRRRMTQAEADIAVRDWLAENAAVDPSKVTRDGIANALGVSTGMVSKTLAWRAFAEARDQGRPRRGREVQMADGMSSMLSDEDATRQAELAELMHEQEADQRRDDRRARRRCDD